MSTRGRKSDYLILLVLAIVSGACILAMVAWGWGRREGPPGPPIPSTRTADPAGTLACYRLFQRLGIPARRSDLPLLSDTLGDFDVLFVLDPLFPLRLGERTAIGQWVRDGGVLVCTAGVPVAGGEAGARRDGCGRGPDGLPDWCRARPERDAVVTQIPRGSSELPLARDVRTIALTGSHVLEIEKWAKTPDLGPAEALLADTAGVRVAARASGEGAAIFLADSSVFGNATIGQADNAIVVANLAAYALARARGTRVGFDEHHFGARGGGAREVLGPMLLTTSGGWAVLAATVAGLLFLAYRGRRFGVRRSPGPVRRRSKMEFVQSVAATFRSAGANRVALRLIFTWFREQCAGLVGLPESSPSAAIADRLARRTGAPPDRYDRVFRQCGQALGGRRLSPRRLARLLKALAEMEAEIVDGHPRGD